MQEIRVTVKKGSRYFNRRGDEISIGAVRHITNGTRQIPFFSVKEGDADFWSQDGQYVPGARPELDLVYEVPGWVAHVLDCAYRIGAGGKAVWEYDPDTQQVTKL